MRVVCRQEGNGRKHDRIVARGVGVQIHANGGKVFALDCDAFKSGKQTGDPLLAVQNLKNVVVLRGRWQFDSSDVTYGTEALLGFSTE
jgi:hypothetical protein